jgi:hypothetical protein
MWMKQASTTMSKNVTLSEVPDDVAGGLPAPRAQTRGQEGMVKETRWFRAGEQICFQVQRLPGGEAKHRRKHRPLRVPFTLPEATPGFKVISW